MTASKDEIKHNSIKLEWIEPELGSESIVNYIISYKDKSENAQGWKVVKTKGKVLSCRIDDLQSLTAYQFKVQAECSAGVSKESELLSLSTLSPPVDRLATKLMNMSTMLTQFESSNVGSHLQIYRLPQMETNYVPDKMIRTVEIGIPPDKTQIIMDKVLMVVGATGAGKSTLINGMVNYILGVEWQDNFRFKLIVDEGATQTKSVTTNITAYTLHHMNGSNLPYTITIIDTPGFGDTAGVEKDKAITEQIKNFFSFTEHYGIDHLDGIGFVTQSALVRLTPTQHYIFDSILAVFGNDVAENIFIMVTFCDGKEPPVIKAVNEAKIPYTQYFKFNNSALDSDNSNVDEENFDKMFWKMGMSSFKKFFVAFQVTNIVSIILTQQVLENRAKLEAAIQGLQRQINACLAEMEVLHQEEIEIQKHEAELETNRCFEYEIKVPYYETIPLKNGEYVTNCLQCNYTCHYPCRIPDNDDKWKCYAMDSTPLEIKEGTGQSACCKVCTGNCPWQVHKNTKERFELRHKFETRTSEDLKKKYDIAASGKSKVERMIKNHSN